MPEAMTIEKFLSLRNVKQISEPINDFFNTVRSFSRTLLHNGWVLIIKYAITISLASSLIILCDTDVTNGAIYKPYCFANRMDHYYLLEKAFIYRGKNTNNWMFLCVHNQPDKDH